MRCLLSTLALILIALPTVGCRSQSPTMTNPFLAPDRVPPPATRTLLPGTAQPYYPGDPVPNTPIIGAPPAGIQAAPIQSAPSTYAPQPAGTVPPGGWNTTPQPYPGTPTSSNFVPSSIQQASAGMPLSNSSVVQVQPDLQSLRFPGPTNNFAPISVPAASGVYLPPEPSILPTPQQGVINVGVQQASFEAPVARQPLLQQPVPVTNPREVRIRAISSDNLRTDGEGRMRDGFRPQGSSQVRKPTLTSRFRPQLIEQSQEPTNRFGFDPDYTWVRGQLEYVSSSGSWSLRYANDQSSSDSFGGNLPIANPQVLGALQAGDFVKLQGHIDKMQLSGTTQKPAYNVSVVQRQRI